MEVPIAIWIEYAIYKLPAKKPSMIGEGAIDL
jgi:hypothetical protein